MNRTIIFIISIATLLSFNNLTAQNEKEQGMKLIYFGDPMCSWCYGFAPEIEAIQEKISDIPLEIVLGGLRPNGQQKMMELKDFLKEHWQEIAHQTSQKFSYDILEVDDFVYNTEPASRAVEVARSLKPEITLSFFRAVQTAFYFENKSTHDINTYLNIAKQFDLNLEKFEALFNSKAIIESTNKNFVKSTEMGVQGFPTLVLQKGEKLHLITNGYQKAEALMPIIEELIGE